MPSSLAPTLYGAAAVGVRLLRWLRGVSVGSARTCSRFLARRTQKDVARRWLEMTARAGSKLSQRRLAELDARAGKDRSLPESAWGPGMRNDRAAPGCAV